MTPAEMIERYIKLRNKIDSIKDKHKKELGPYLDLHAQLETLILQHLDQQGLQSMNGEAGTAFKQVATSVTVKDWNKTLSFIKEHELWDLLEARVSKTAAVEVITERKQPIPGVLVSQAVVVRVRSS